MSPRKQPSTLFDICVKSCVRFINTTCSVIAESYSENEIDEREKQTTILKNHVMSLIPPRFFDVLCSARTCYPYEADPRIQLTVLMHPNMTVFRKRGLDYGISQRYWIETLPCFNKLVILDLKYVCSDEILQIIGISCPLLEELNIISRLHCFDDKSNEIPFNVSDAGLCAIANLKQLRILSMDPPTDDGKNRMGRCISEDGLIMLLSELPCLEELRMELYWDIYSTLISTNIKVGPLSLRKIKCHIGTADVIWLLLKVFPHLDEFSVLHFYDMDDILDQISASDLRLTRLDLIYFSYSPSFKQLLVNKGSYLTHFSLLWETTSAFTLDAVIAIGLHCPNLNSFSLTLGTPTKRLMVSRWHNFTRPDGIFKELKTLTLELVSCPMGSPLLFFLECTRNLQTLYLKYHWGPNIDKTLMIALDKNYFKNVSFLWFSHNIRVSKEVVKTIIRKCEKLKHFTVNLYRDNNMSDVQNYIRKNNLDLKLSKWY